MTATTLSPTPTASHPSPPDPEPDGLLSSHLGSDGAVEGVALEAATVPGQVAFGLAVLVAWVVVGMVVAVVVSRRGHDLAPVAALGFLLGPLLAVYAASTVARRERETAPVVVDDGVEMDGDLDVLIALVGADPDLAAARPMLRSLGDRLRTVTVAATVTFETAGEADAVARSRRSDTADSLRRSATALFAVEPRLVLLPGRPASALATYAEEHQVDRIVVVGDDDERAAIERELDRRGAPVALTASRRGR